MECLEVKRKLLRQRGAEKAPQEHEGTQDYYRPRSEKKNQSRTRTRHATVMFMSPHFPPSSVVHAPVISVTCFKPIGVIKHLEAIPFHTLH